MELSNLTKPEWIDSYVFDGKSHNYIDNQRRRFVAEICSAKLVKKTMNLSPENIASAITLSVLTDDPNTLASAMSEWLKWAFKRCGLHNISCQQFEVEIKKHLESNNDLTNNLTKRLLEDGFSPYSVGSKEAFMYLCRQGYNNDYLKEFLNPPSSMAWKGIYVHYYWDIFPESPISLTYH